MKYIEVFRHSRFRSGRKLLPGDYYLSALARLRLIKLPFGDSDAISSLKIPQGMMVELFKDGECKGEPYRLFESEITELGEWNDKIKSMRVRSLDHIGPSHPVVKSFPVVFEHPDYKGNSLILEPGLSKDLGKTAVGNDTISSVHVPEGYVVILYEHGGNRRGRVLGLDMSINNLNKLNFHNITTEIKVFRELDLQNKLNYEKRSLGIPPQLTGLHSSNLPEESERVVVGESIIPFMYVNDSYWENSPDEQSKQSPFYKITREIAWAKGDNYEHPGGLSGAQELQLKTGLTTTEMEKIRKSVSIEITNSGGIGFQLPLSEKGSFSLNLSRSKKVSREIETEYSETESMMVEKIKKFTINFGVDPATWIIWGKRNYLSVRSLSDNRLVTEWSYIEEHDIVADVWPPAEGDHQSRNIKQILARVHA